MILHRWDYKTHTYQPFESPAKETAVYSEDMNRPVDCGQCGKSMTFGDGYTSREIHNDYGLGYPVCSPCYDKETERARQDRGGF